MSVKTSPRKSNNDTDLCEDIDLAIFKNIESSSPTTNCHSYSTCLPLKRLILSLKYFTKLDIANNINDQHIFCNFMDNSYSIQIHDDMYHLIKYHQTDLEDIYRNLLISKYNFTPCHLDNCHHSNRHYRIEKEKIITNINDNQEMKYLNLYIETLIHYIFYYSIFMNHH